MKALLDIEIARYREQEPSNETIRNLFYWLDKLNLKKCIHSNTKEELCHFQSYEIISIPALSNEFVSGLAKTATSRSEKNADALLFAVYIGLVDVLITDDGRTLANAEGLNLSNKVMNINRFITGALYKNPTLINYKALAVKATTFKECDLNDPFFDNFKKEYDGFEAWFKKKANEEVYVCKGDSAYLGFLYLKFEDVSEKYDDITPKFEPKRRLKVGTFKVESSGFRLGERFIQIIFDHAQKYNVDEIYITLFKDRPELQLLYKLLSRWGFIDYGTKVHSNGNTETVMTKQIAYDMSKSVQENFPAVQYRKRKLFLPIKAKFHSRLIPDSEKGCVDLVKNEACRYALEKVYITTAGHNPIIKGDLLLIYRIGDMNPKAYSSIVTTVGVVKEIKQNFLNKEDFMAECQNRSVFTTAELNLLWSQYSNSLGVVRFFALRTFENRPNLKWLWDNGILEFPNGPRPFTEIRDEQFDAVLNEAKITDIKWF